MISFGLDDLEHWEHELHHDLPGELVHDLGGAGHRRADLQGFVNMPVDSAWLHGLVQSVDVGFEPFARGTSAPASYPGLARGLSSLDPVSWRHTSSHLITLPFKSSISNLTRLVNYYFQ